MKKNNQEKDITRRKFLPFLGGGLLLPFLGSTKTVDKIIDVEGDQTLLTKDGKVVKVKASILTKSEIVEKQLSNKSLLNWLKKNDRKT